MKRSIGYIAFLLALAMYGTPETAMAQAAKSTGNSSKAQPGEKANQPEAEAQPAEATSVKAKESSKTQVKETTARQRPVTATPNPKAKTEKPAERRQAEARFQDRDGDGLRDGQESRFRGRYRRTDDRSRETGNNAGVLRTCHRYGANGTSVGHQARRANQ